MTLWPYGPMTLGSLQAKPWRTIVDRSFQETTIDCIQTPAEPKRDANQGQSSSLRKEISRTIRNGRMW